MKLYIAFIILSLKVIFVFGQSYSNGDIVYVISETGLNLRTEKNVNSQVVKLISAGRKLRILDSDCIINLTSINNIKGSWIKVMDYLDSSIGFVFDFYLSKYPPFKFKRNKNNECWGNDLLLDLANELGKLDSIEYSNYNEGEGWYNMKYYKLNKEVKYIEHGHWEHYENELQFSNLNTYQIIHYVNSILMHCKENINKIEHNYFEKNKIMSLYKYGDCCVQNIRIYSEGNILIIRIQPDPGT